MATLELDKIFNPKSIAVIGASDEEGSVGRKLITNILAWKEGKVYPVNIRKKEILGQKAYQSISEITETVDLAVIATPAKTVPGVLEECGKAGVKGAIIISAGFKETGAEGLALEKRLIEIKNAYNMRIIGPNCLGIIRPGSNLNASFANKMPGAGNIAFISQSGALGSAILDWAAHENIGFSNFVSVGSMIDVAFSDLIDYFGTDTRTRSILMYIEGITSAKKFMSAARHFARTKPIIVIKAGRFSESAKAAASHTGALAGESAVYNAAFKRAGVLVVDEIEDLFNCTEVLSMQPNPKGPNLAIITNAGGPGVMSTDALIARNGKLAKLSQKTLDRLNEVLPPFWSKSNPIDILGDANADRYKAVVEACLSDEGIDGLLVIYTPQGGANPNDIAIGVAELWRNSSRDKTLLTSFMGYSEVEEANQSFRKYSIPTYETPDQAVATYMYMYQYERNLELLYETPEELSVDDTPPKRPLTVLIQNAAKEGRQILTEVEAKKILAYYGIPVVKTFVAKSADEAATLASQVG
ncbi:CoA-binding protein, partial [Candidatus Bathyarchaeota archaeon]|nr:CoA-binding protein [Candidatus Bathyarchaeota archaeon]